MALTIEGGIAIGLIAFCFLLAIYLASRRSYRSSIEKPESIKHYEKVRDELTDRESEPEADEEEYASEQSDESSGSPMVAILMGFVLIAIIGGFIALNSFVSSDYALGGNYTEDSASLMVTDSLGDVGEVIVEWLDLIVLLIVLGFIIGMFARVASMFNGSDEPERKKNPVNKRVPKKSDHIEHYEGMRDKMTLRKKK